MITEIKTHKLKIDTSLSKPEEVASIIRDKICMQEYTNGKILTEVKLSKELNVSRSVVRTAFKELIDQGLIINMANGRKKVIGFTKQYIIDLFDIRKVLETKAIEGILNNDKLRMRFLSKAIQIVDLINDDRYKSAEKHADLDYLFHKTIVEESENYIVLQCWNTIAPLLITIWKINTAYEKEHAKYYDIHTEIVQFIVKHDEKSIKLLSKHFDESRDMIINTLELLKYI